MTGPRFLASCCVAEAIAVAVLLALGLLMGWSAIR